VSPALDLPKDKWKISQQWNCVNDKFQKFTFPATPPGDTFLPYNLAQFMKLPAQRSSRHSKISGNFGESLVLYWLSKHGFECAFVDHTGIDIIALNPTTNELMGISVKCRDRKAGKETECTLINGSEFAKLDAACKVFGCKPYFAMVVDANDWIRVFITSRADFLRLAPLKKHCYWKTTPAALAAYAADERVISFALNTKTIRWW
jgi:Holliday junction resolvase-like predicted endonuclease